MECRLSHVVEVYIRPKKSVMRRVYLKNPNGNQITFKNQQTGKNYIRNHRFEFAKMRLEPPGVNNRPPQDDL